MAVVSLWSGLAFAQETPSTTTQPLQATESNTSGLPFNLNAESVEYDTQAGTITATGTENIPVKVTSPDGTLTAQKLVYHAENDTLTATGNVRFADPQGNLLVVDTLNLTGSLKTGTADALRLSIPKLGEVMQADSAVRTSSATYQLSNVVYSPCKECVGTRKAWTIHADQMNYKPDEGEITYRNAWLDVYGAPVMYLPYFEHPIGPRKAKSGMLFPQFGRSTINGEELRLAGYVTSPEENADYTIRTRLMSQRGLLGQVERRQVTDHTNTEIRGSYLNDNYTSKVRSNLNLIGDYTFQPGLRVGANGEIASDDTYLNDFFNRNDPYLDSTIYGEWDNRDRYLALSATRFQDLDSTRDPATTAQIFPHFQYEQNLETKDGSWLTLSADAVSLQRDEGPQSRRVVTQANILKPMLFTDGSQLRLSARARLDAYNVDGSTSNVTNDGWISRALPEATFDWEKPYISPGGNHTISPRVMGALSFRGGNPPGVPNEDSVAYELDMANLFEPSRFAGLDRVESGPRLVYGLDNRWGSASLTRWRLFVGQGVRQFDDNDLPQSGGAATTISDWVGFAEANPADWFALTQHMRLDNATFEPRRLDTIMRLGWSGDERPWMNLTYSFLDNDTENFNSRANLPLTENWRLVGSTRNDIRNSRTLEAETGVVYRRDCFDIGFTVRRRGFENGDLQPSTDYLVNVQLLTLGADYE